MKKIMVMLVFLIVFSGCYGYRQSGVFRNQQSENYSNCEKQCESVRMVLPLRKQNSLTIKEDNNRQFLYKDCVMECMESKGM